MIARPPVVRTFHALGGRRGRYVVDRAAGGILPFLLEPSLDPAAPIKRKGGRALAAAPLGFLVKHYTPKNPWRRLLSTFLPSPAANAFNQHVRLERAGVPVPAAIGCLVIRRPFPLYRESWFLLERIPETISLRDHLIRERALYASADPRRLEPFFAVAGLIARLHASGWFHQDLHTKNVLVSEPAGGPPLYWLIDLDSSVALAGLPYLLFLVLRFCDLRRFVLSLRYWVRGTDRERFLAAYFAHFPRGRRERRLFARFLAFTAFFSSQEDKRKRRDTKTALALEWQAALREQALGKVEEPAPRE